MRLQKETTIKVQLEIWIAFSIIWLNATDQIESIKWTKQFRWGTTCTMYDSYENNLYVDGDNSFVAFLVNGYVYIYYLSNSDGSIVNSINYELNPGVYNGSVTTSCSASSIADLKKTSDRELRVMTYWSRYSSYMIMRFRIEDDGLS